MSFLKSVAFLIAVLCPVAAWSQVPQSFYMHQPWISARILGMGGAFTAVADDYQSLYYNSAGLARLTEGQVVADFYVEGTPAIIGFESSLSSAGSNSSNIQNVLTNNFGSHFASRVGLGGTWVRPGWGVGFQPLDLTVELDINGTAAATLGVEAFQDTFIQFGKAWNIGDSKAFSVGIAPKTVYRAAIIQNENVFQLIQNSSNIFVPQDASEGLTFDTDIGALYTVPIPEDGWFQWLKYAKPTFGFAVRNLIDYGFPTNLHLYNSQTSSNPLNLGRRFDLGSNFQLPDFWVFHPHVMIDFHDMGMPQASFIKCSHFGAELKWKAFSWLNGGYRMGLSEGYFTAGISAEMANFMLDLAAYSEEIGTTQSPVQSTRYIAQLSLDF